LSRPKIIAIDGPVATGKTVIGRLLSEEMEYRFLDTGTLYRAIAWLSIQHDINPWDETALTAIASKYNLDIIGNERRILINGNPVQLEHYRVEIDKIVSLIASVSGVRDSLIQQQRKLADQGNIVIVGRDIGTVVAPHATLKLYLQATAEERTKRRFAELQRSGHTITYAEVLSELCARDRLDSERSHSPLKPAGDAYMIDTDGLTIDQVLSQILEIIGGL